MPVNKEFTLMTQNIMLKEKIAELKETIKSNTIGYILDLDKLIAKLKAARGSVD